MYKLQLTSKFKKDLKRVQKRGYDLSLLEDVIDLIMTGEPLPEKYREHNLSGEYSDCKECHITPDWLLVYEIVETSLVLYLTRTGTHSDLF
ncbi:MAG: type II toxin-antitoxin system YafQ family toxin [Clostridiales bacterium]|nr:type II toxin-antitoxin system YafQ family toxin [Clostridiales bacterium]